MIKKNLQKIFKKISYGIFLTIYGKVDKIVEADKNQNVKIFKPDIEGFSKYKVYEVNGARLYTDRIYNTAIILENSIVKGPSFQLRNHNNSKIEDNIVLSIGTPRKLIKFDGKILSLLTGGGGNENYWHWLYDVLPRLELCNRCIKLENIDYFLFPSLKKKFQLETLNILNIPVKKYLSSEKCRHIKSKKLIVTDHPFAITNNVEEDELKIPNWILVWLKKKFIKHSKLSTKNFPKKIYIDRNELNSNLDNSRSIINEKEVKDFLQKKGFTPIQLGSLSFIEQVKLFNEADHVIGLHGAGFANVTFCKSKTKILEFRTKKTGKVIENLSLANELSYRSIICETEGPSEAQFGHIKIPISLLEEKIKY